MFSQLFKQDHSDHSSDSFIEGSDEASIGSWLSETTIEPLRVGTTILSEPTRVPDKKMSRKLNKATERREHARQTEAFAYLVPMSRRISLTPRIIRYAGMNTKGIDHYEVDLSRLQKGFTQLQRSTTTKADPLW
jgi:hypothetical protein